MTDPATQHQNFLRAVELLGGTRSAARAIGCTERTMSRLIAQKSPLHEGWLKDTAAALLRLSDDARALEKVISPAFARNLYEGQPRETRRTTRHKFKWHPIETAWDDGSVILLRGGQPRNSNARWPHAKPVAAWWDEAPDGTGWRFGSNDFYDGPTEWAILSDED